MPILEELEQINVYPAKHFVTPRERVKDAIADIKEELEERLIEFEKAAEYRDKIKNLRSKLLSL